MPTGRGAARRYRVCEHGGGLCTLKKGAHPRRSPVLLSTADSVASKHLARKHKQILDACGDAVVVFTFDSILNVLKGICVGPDGL